MGAWAELEMKMCFLRQPWAKCPTVVKYIHSSWMKNSAIMKDWKFLMFSTRVIFRIQLKIYDRAFLQQ